MKQVVQSSGHGTLRVVEVPTPTPSSTDVLVATRRSLLSSGTERTVREMASSSLIQKARRRPDLVRQVMTKAKTDGLRATARAVKERLDDETPLGYCAAGVVVSSGDNTPGLARGTRVATASAGHAEMQSVPGLLAVQIPDNVTDEEAAFGAVAAIALQGLRQADVGPGGTVLVVGLGLVGQLTTRLALASGLNVIGVDLRAWTATMASAAGAHGLVESGPDTTEAVHALTKGRGADAALITASTPSSDPVMLACDRIRDRGRVVVVGDVGLELARAPFYNKEIELRFARSYGPGRYDPSYEGLAVDYPIGHVRWTEGRNIEAYLDLVSRGRVAVDDLVTHVFSIDEAEMAYETISSNPEALAVQFSYDLEVDAPALRVEIKQRGKAMGFGAGLVGAGEFAKAVFAPALKRAGWGEVLAVTSSNGLSARHLAERHGIATVAASVDDLLSMPDISTVFVLSRHDSHSSITSAALRAGKNVFVEKPLALSDDELEDVVQVLNESPGQLWMGFNRRHSEAVLRAKEAFSSSGPGPLVLNYRISAGRLPNTHWYKDRRQGGRLLGEVCHFLDTASWIVGAAPTRVLALGSGNDESLLQDDLTLAASFADGSSVAITYAAGGHSSTPKERLEILGRGHSVIIDDFVALAVDGKSVKLANPGKGHSQNLERFRKSVAGEIDGSSDLNASINTTAAMLAAAKSLIGGAVEVVPARVG